MKWGFLSRMVRLALNRFEQLDNMLPGSFFRLSVVRPLLQLFEFSFDVCSREVPVFRFVGNSVDDGDGLLFFRLACPLLCGLSNDH